MLTDPVLLYVLAGLLALVPAALIGAWEGR
jgi:hypothetical protein